MSNTLGYPVGFFTNVKWQFEGDIPPKVWKAFRTKFAAEHAPGWKVKKLCTSYRGHKHLTVSFRTNDPDATQGMTGEHWQFLHAAVSLLVTKTEV